MSILKDHEFSRFYETRKPRGALKVTYMLKVYTQHDQPSTSSSKRNVTGKTANETSGVVRGAFHASSNRSASNEQSTNVPSSSSATRDNSPSSTNHSTNPSKPSNNSNRAFSRDNDTSGAGISTVFGRDNEKLQNKKKSPRHEWTPREEKILEIEDGAHTKDSLKETTQDSEEIREIHDSQERTRQTHDSQEQTGETRYSQEQTNHILELELIERIKQAEEEKYGPEKLWDENGCDRKTKAFQCDKAPRDAEGNGPGNCRGGMELMEILVDDVFITPTGQIKNKEEYEKEEHKRFLDRVFRKQIGTVSNVTSTLTVCNPILTVCNTVSKSNPMPAFNNEFCDITSPLKFTYMNRPDPDEPNNGGNVFASTSLMARSMVGRNAFPINQSSTDRTTASSNTSSKMEYKNRCITIITTLYNYDRIFPLFRCGNPRLEITGLQSNDLQDGFVKLQFRKLQQFEILIRALPFLRRMPVRAMYSTNEWRTILWRKIREQCSTCPIMLPFLSIALIFVLMFQCLILLWAYCMEVFVAIPLFLCKVVIPVQSCQKTSNFLWSDPLYGEYKEQAINADIQILLLEEIEKILIEEVVSRRRAQNQGQATQVENQGEATQVSANNQADVVIKPSVKSQKSLEEMTTLVGSKKGEALEKGNVKGATSVELPSQKALAPFEVRLEIWESKI